MKIKLVYTLTLILTVSFAICNVSAANHASTIDATKILVCSYGDTTNSNQGAEIYYSFAKIDGSAYERWEISYRKGGIWRIKTSGGFNTTFSGNTAIHKDNDGDRFPSSYEETFTCPTNNFMDFDFIDELCFGNYNSCGSEFEGGPYGQAKDGDSIFEIINKYAEEDVYQYLSATQIQNNGNVLNFVKSRTRTYITTKYAFGATFVMPPFIDNYLNTLETHIDLNNTAAYDEARTRIEDQLERRRVEAQRRADEAERNFANGTITQEELEQARSVAEHARQETEQVQEELSETLYEAMGSPPVNGVNVSDEADCHGLLGVQMTEIVNNVFSFVQYLAPVLIAALSIVDFVKASLSGDDGDMKKASQKLVKRAICGVLLFFIPLLCKVLFGIAGITVPEYCIGR